MGETLSLCFLCEKVKCPSMSFFSIYKNFESGMWGDQYCRSFSENPERREDVPLKGPMIRLEVLKSGKPSVTSRLASPHAKRSAPQVEPRSLS